MNEVIFWKAMALAHKAKLNEIRTEVKELYGKRNDLMTELNSCVVETKKKSLLNLKISIDEKELNFCIKQSLRKRKCYLRCLHKADSLEFAKITNNISNEVLHKFGINTKDEINDLSKLLNPRELNESLSYCQSNKEKLNTQDVTTIVTIFPYIKKSFEMIKHNEELLTEIMRFDTVNIKDVIQNLESIVNKINKTIEIGKQND